MSSKRLRPRSLIPLYINGISTNDILNIRIEGDCAFIEFYNREEEKSEKIIMDQSDPSYHKFETYMLRHNSMFYMSKL